MTKLLFSVALVILSVGYISSAAIRETKHSNSEVSQYLQDDEENTEDDTDNLYEEEYETRGGPASPNEHDEQDLSEYLKDDEENTLDDADTDNAENEPDENTGPKIVNTMVNILASPEKRDSIVGIVNKVKSVFTNSDTRELLNNVMKNVNYLVSEPEYRDLIKEGVAETELVLMDEENRLLVSYIHAAYDILFHNDHTMHAMNTVMNAIRAMFHDEDSKRLVLASAIAIEKIMGRKDIVQQIVYSAMRIINDKETKEFIANISVRLRPLLITNVNSQQAPVVVKQEPKISRSLSANGRGKSPSRAPSIRRSQSFDNSSKAQPRSWSFGL